MTRPTLLLALISLCPMLNGCHYLAGLTCEDLDAKIIGYADANGDGVEVAMINDGFENFFGNDRVFNYFLTMFCVSAAIFVIAVGWSLRNSPGLGILIFMIVWGAILTFNMQVLYTLLVAEVVERRRLRILLMIICLFLLMGSMFVMPFALL